MTRSASEKTIKDLPPILEKLIEVWPVGEAKGAGDAELRQWVEEHRERMQRLLRDHIDQMESLLERVMTR